MLRVLKLNETHHCRDGRPDGLWPYHNEKRKALRSNKNCFKLQQSIIHFPTVPVANLRVKSNVFQAQLKAKTYVLLRNRAFDNVKPAETFQSSEFQLTGI
jgi:hypothetical protein